MTDSWHMQMVIDSPHPGKVEVPLRDDEDAWDDLAEVLEKLGSGTFSVNLWSISISCSVEAHSAGQAVDYLDKKWRAYAKVHKMSDWEPIVVSAEKEDPLGDFDEASYSYAQAADAVGRSRPWVYAQQRHIGRPIDGRFTRQQVRDLALLANSSPATTDHPIAQARLRHNLSQSDLADRIGVAISTISRWERNLTTPRTSQLKALQEALGPLELR